jgi:hypothetical protein
VLEDHLGAQWNFIKWRRMQSILEKIRLPLIVFSLGCCGYYKAPIDIANEISEESKNFFLYLSDRAISIGIRGKTTAKVLDLLGVKNYQVVGCPTYFEAGPDRLVAAPSIAVDSKVVATGWFSSNTLTNVHYVLQGEPELLRGLIDLGAYPQADAASFMGVPWPNLPGKILHALDNDRVRFYTDPQKWAGFFDDSVALTVGSRMHGGIVSINKGRPTIVTNGDVRATEMCALFKIPHYPEADFFDSSPSDLADRADPTELNLAYGDLYQTFRSWLIDVCKLPVPSEPLTTLEWAIHQVKMLPGPIVAERIRGAASAARSESFQHNLEQCNAQQVETLARLAALQQNHEAALLEHALIKSRSVDLGATLSAMEQSKSWRITAPLRRIASFVKNLK